MGNDTKGFTTKLLNSLQHRDRKNAIHYLLELATVQFQADAACLYAFQEDGQTQLFPLEEYVKNSNVYPLSALSKETILNLPQESLTRFQTDLYGGQKSSVAIPLLAGNVTVGALVMIYQKSVHIPNEDSLLILASYLGMYVNDLIPNEDGEQTRSYQKERIRRQQAELMRLMKDSRLNSFDLVPAFQMICESAADTLQVDRVSIWLFNKDETALVCQTLFDKLTNRFQQARDLQKDTFPAYFKALQRDRSIVVDDTESDDRVSELKKIYLDIESIQSMMDIPIIRGGDMIGVLCCEQVGRTRVWSLDEEVFAASIGDIVAFTIEHLKRKEAEQQARKLAYYDYLTDLPNQNLISEKLDERLEEDDLTPFAFIYLDVDHFTKINEGLGYRIGDQLLMAITRRLKENLKTGDLFGRLGHNGFSIMTSREQKKTSLYKKIEAYKRLFHDPFIIDDQKLVITASAGIALFPEHGDNPAVLIRNAHTATRKGKKEGHSLIKFYHPSMDEENFESLWVEMNLAQAIEEEQLQLYYQPQVRLESGRVTGFEALARWIHPEKGIIPPSEFIPLAEVTGLIIPLGEWGLKQAAWRLKEFETKELSDLTISVNISPQQFQHPRFIDKLREILQETLIDSSKLVLEITETIALEHESYVIEKLKAIEEMGVQLAIDDFGTGYSSLQYLSLFPLQILKIDRSFMKDWKKNPKNEAIVNTILHLGRSLDLEIVAEGVETKEMVDRLKELNSDCIQGYYVSKPLPGEELYAWIDQSKGGELR
ncbi:GGDEF domain-containing protein [Halobacillus fulvus]|nr:GGDEF domain-containing protein [Halobacillus fulvus]